MMPNQRPNSDHAAAIADSRPVFRREGEYWTIAFAGATCRLRNSAGLRHLAYLLARPGERVAAVELVAIEESAQWAVDSRQSEIVERTAYLTADSPTSATADCPLPTADSLTAGTTDCLPPTADSLTVERARVRVTHAIRHTLRRIAMHHVELNEHFQATIKTGMYCAYLPDPRRPVSWELRTT
jgi:hypothetical protein